VSSLNWFLKINNNMTFSSEDFFWMKLALKLANYAFQKNEVPIGALVVRDNKLLGIGWNQPISSNDPTSHAEINALRDAALNIANYRLINTSLYVTLEPCGMCLGAIQYARCDRIIFGAYADRLKNDDLLMGSCKFSYEGGLLEKECSNVLKTFFALKRADVANLTLCKK
jgi:tRNA(adenine34) deaminase